MEQWIIEPYDPLIVRDGRPFGPNPGARARSLPFPFPSTIAGGLRTRAGEDSSGLFDSGAIDEVLKIAVRGPLLVELDAKDEVHWMAPAPRDALLLQDNESREITRHRLRPLLYPPGALDDLPPELSYATGLAEPDLRKPFKDAPNYWHWQHFAEWLFEPPPLKTLTTEELAALGHDGPGSDRRVHVAIDPQSLSGIDGGLFATSGLTFLQQPQSDSLHAVRRLALAVTVENQGNLTIDEGLAPLGGERRLMRWQRTGTPFPALAEAVIEGLVKSGHCRLILLTPAIFDNGWRPHWLLQPLHGVQARLKAAVTGKPQTISGWDFVKKGPKKTRRLVPAGSVYFLELDGDEAARREWVKAIWLQNVSDIEEDRQSGFGLAALGTWSGEPLEVHKEVADDA